MQLRTTIKINHGTSPAQIAAENQKEHYSMYSISVIIMAFPFIFGLILAFVKKYFTVTV